MSAKKQMSSKELVEIGRKAPAFSMADQEENIHRLKDYLGQWVVLYFYPKDDTSGCTKEACQFRDARDKYRRRHAAVLGVSPDDAASHAKFAGKYKLPFTLLADVGAKTCTTYGVYQEKSMYGRKYMGVVRTTYLIDPRGKIARRWDKVKVDGHEREVLDAIDELRKKS